jgi:hypothetical protein
VWSALAGQGSMAESQQHGASVPGYSQFLDTEHLFV